MEKIDLSKLGWRYTEIRGENPRVFVGEMLETEQDSDIEPVEIQQQKAKDLGFFGFKSNNETRFARKSDKRMTPLDLMELFNLPKVDDLFVTGPQRFAPVAHKTCTFSTLETTRPEEVMSAFDHKAKKRASELNELEFNALLAERRMPLSQIRRLHGVLNPNGEVSETGILHTIQTIRDTFNSDLEREAVTITCYNGLVFNPPVQIIVDEKFKKESFFDLRSNYLTAEQAVVIAHQRDSTKASARSHEAVAGALYSEAEKVKSAFGSAHIAKVKASESRPKATEPASQPANQTDQGVDQAHRAHIEAIEPHAGASLPIDDPLGDAFEFPLSSPVIETREFDTEELSSSIDAELVHDVVKQPGSVAEFLRGKSVLSLIPSEANKVLMSWLSEYKNHNPEIKDETFLMSTRMFMRETIELYWANPESYKASQHEISRVSSRSGSLAWRADPDHASDGKPSLSGTASNKGLGGPTEAFNPARAVAEPSSAAPSKSTVLPGLPITVGHPSLPVQKQVSGAQGLPVLPSAVSSGVNAAAMKSAGISLPNLKAKGVQGQVQQAPRRGLNDTHKSTSSTPPENKKPSKSVLSMLSKASQASVDEEVLTDEQARDLQLQKRSDLMDAGASSATSQAKPEATNKKPTSSADILNL